MSMNNIIAGFRVTGVYPLDRSKLKPSTSMAADSIQSETNLPYIPLLSPAPRRHTIAPITPSFTEKEMSSFHGRYQREMEEQSDESNERYQLWRSMYHPHDESISEDGPSTLDDSYLHTPLKKGTHRANVVKLAQPRSTVQHMLGCPTPPTSIPSAYPKKTNRVLTSAENLKNIEEKQRRKKKLLN